MLRVQSKAHKPAKPKPVRYFTHRSNRTGLHGTSCRLPCFTKALRHPSEPTLGNRPSGTHVCKHFNDGYKVTGYLFIGRGDVPADIHGHAEDLAGKTYKDWTTLPDNPALLDFTPHP